MLDAELVEPNVAADIMTSYSSLRVVDVDTAGLELLDELYRSEYQGFPVINNASERRILGYIEKRDLGAAIKKAVRVESALGQGAPGSQNITRIVEFMDRVS